MTQSVAGDRLQMRIILDPMAGVVKEIDDIIIDVNQRTLGVKRQSLVVAAYDQDQLVGGVYVRWYADSAMLDLMAVKQGRRGNGVGRRLVEAVEKELTARGCRQIMVDTMAYHAPGFYQRLGYEVAATIPNYYAEHSRIVLRKVISAP